MPVVQPENPWSPYPVGRRDPKPSKLIQIATCRQCGWSGAAAELRSDSGCSADRCTGTCTRFHLCPACASPEIDTETTSKAARS